MIVLDRILNQENYDNIRIETIYQYYEKVAKANICKGDAKSLSSKHDTSYTNTRLSVIKLINLHLSNTSFMIKTDHFLPLFLSPEPPKDPFCDALALSSLSACFIIPIKKIKWGQAFQITNDHCLS